MQHCEQLQGPTKLTKVCPSPSLQVGALMMATGIAHKNGPKKYWWAIGYISGRHDKCCINFSESDIITEKYCLLNSPEILD